jgi:AraC-like DNA-binding protein
MQTTTSHFDVWTLVFLVAAVQGLFVAFVLARWRQGPQSANRLLAMLLLLFSITLGEYVLFWSNSLMLYPHAAQLTAQFPFLFGPLIYLYCRTIYEERPLQTSDLLHAVPFLLAIAVCLPWYVSDAESKRAIMMQQAAYPVPRILMQIILWGRIAHLSAYAVWNFRYIRRQPAVGDTARWALTLNGFFVGFIIAYTSYYILVRFSFFNVAWDYHISAVMTAFIYLIAWSGYTRRAVFDGYAWTEPNAPAKYRNSGLTPEAGRSLLQSLEELMVIEKCYQDPDITLEKLAGMLNASKHHVSQTINERLGVSFFEYINQLRIEEAKNLLVETSRDEMHVIQVAYAVGFNNKVSFNAAFKKSTGMTPTAYRRSHRKSDTAAGQPGAVERG